MSKRKFDFEKMSKDEVVSAFKLELSENKTRLLEKTQIITTKLGVEKQKNIDLKKAHEKEIESIKSGPKNAYLNKLSQVEGRHKEEIAEIVKRHGTAINLIDIENTKLITKLDKLKQSVEDEKEKSNKRIKDKIIELNDVNKKELDAQKSNFDKYLVEKVTPKIELLKRRETELSETLLKYKDLASAITGIGKTASTLSDYMTRDARK